MSDVPVISLFDTHEGGDDFFSSLASTNNNDPFANSTNSSAEVQASSTSPLSNQSQLEQWNTIQSETLSFKDESSHENSFFDTIANAEVVSDTSSFLQQDIKHDVATSPIVTSTISRQETINEKPSKSELESTAQTKPLEEATFSFSTTGTEEESFFDQLSQFPQTPIANVHATPSPLFSQVPAPTIPAYVPPPVTPVAQPPVNVFTPSTLSNFPSSNIQSAPPSVNFVTPAPTPFAPKVFTPSPFPEEKPLTVTPIVSPMRPPPPTFFTPTPVITPTPTPIQPPTPSVLTPNPTPKIFTPNTGAVNVFTPSTTPSPITTFSPSIPMPSVPAPITPVVPTPTPYMKPPLNVFTPSSTEPITNPLKPLSTMKPPAPQIFNPTVPATSPQFSRMAPSSSSSVPRERGAHPIVSFGFGGKLVTMFPRKRMKIVFNSPGPVEGFVPGPISVSNLGKLFQNTEFYKSMASFPGPLTSSSAKDKVIQFINERIANSKNEYSGLQQQDTSLLWELLKILCNNYGSLSNTEGSNAQQLVRELLLLKESSEYQESPLRISNTSESEAQHLLEVQKFIIAGKIDEGYKYAVANQLWSHALVLASNLGTETFRNTVQQFSEFSLQEGSPIRSMYLLFSGKIRELFTPSFNQSGDSNPGQQIAGLLSKWRENIAVVLANRNPNDNNYKAIIGEIGDKLWMFQRRAEAAHFCYLLAEHEFEYIDNRNARLVALGADHKTKIRNLFIADNLQRTEIAEFSRMQGNSQYLLPQVQVLKLVYAHQLCELGLMDQAKKYHQLLLQNVNKSKGSAQYNNIFLNQLEVLGERLNAQTTKQSSGWSIPLPKISGVGSLLGKVKLFGNSSSTGDLQQMDKDPSPRNTIVPSGSSGSLVTMTPSANVTAPVTPTKTMPAPEPSPPKPQESKKEGPESKKSTGGSNTLLSRFSGFLSPILQKGLKADLGEENQFEYNKELGVWLKKGQKPESVALAPPPPPPSDPSPPSFPSVSSPAPPSPMTSAPPDQSLVTPPMPGTPPVNKFSSSASGSRRRYVDTFNPESGSVTTAHRRTTSDSLQNSANIKLFTPAPIPITEAPQEEQPNPSPGEDATSQN